MTPSLPRPAVAALSLVLLAPLLPATWSIVLVDTRTKEIAVGSATCVASLDLRQFTPVLLVGKGAATAQARGDATGQNRLLIFGEIRKGTAPAQILSLLAQRDPSHQSRQYGIVDTRGRSLTFSGSQNFTWAGGVTGKIGTIVYAIQGNILFGQAVVTKAEAAVRSTRGDLAAKLMAGMEAAAAAGGDRRCTSAGKSADVGYMLVARQGDKDGTCNVRVGCASGTYYMGLNVALMRRKDADPVRGLRLLYDYWRLEKRGRPDHHLSSVVLDPPTLPIDGRTRTTATLTLRDLDGTQLTGKNAKVTVTLDPSSTAQVTIGTVTAQGNGVYSLPLRAGSKAGKALLRIVVDDGQGPVLLSPRRALDLTADPLWASRTTLSTTRGGATDFVLQPGPSRAKRLYLVLGSSSGSSPGIRFGSVRIPVNPDPFFRLFLSLTNRPPIFVRTAGALDAKGLATARFQVPPAMLDPLRGSKLTFAYVLLRPVDLASNPVVVTLQR